MNILPYLALIWLSAICLGCLTFLNFQTINDADLVFCPLQKSWVKRNPPVEKSKSSILLEEICSSNKQKENFIYESLQKLSLAKISLNAQQTENLFFDYADKGNEVFTTFSNSHSLPENDFVRSGSSEKAVLSLQKDFLKKESGITLLQNQSRPPTIQTTANFISQKFVELKNISRKISPRAPPVLV